MADQSSTISKNVQFKYRLILGNIISKETPGQLTLIQNDRVLMDDKENEKSYYATLCGVKVNKKIYQPTEIEAEIDFMMKTSDDSTGKETIKAPSFRAVSALFLQREVTVDFIEVPDTTFGDDSYTDCPTHTVSKKCYVYEVNPLLKRDVNGRKMCVKLNIFSMDKLMTLNKYSKAYVARKLGEQILKPESLTFGTKTDGTTPLVKTLTDLRFLFYEENNEKREFIQPYLVQYNESFYDFLVRTANRCGEFLYFEDGALTLGLPDSGDPLVIDDYMSVTEQGVSTDPLEITAYRRDSMKEREMKDEGELNISVVDKGSDGYPKDAFPENTSSNSELATDEYLFPLMKDRFSDTFAR